MKNLYSEQSSGRYGWFNLEIKVDARQLPDLKAERIHHATYDAVKLIKSAIMAEVISGDKEAQESAVKEREALLSLFPSQIFVEEIPNGYCSDYCCKHLPWFVVTTRVGRFKIGWRKSVIQIEWTETRHTKTAKDLFPNENVTMEGKMIHAWSMEKAREYVETILTNLDL